MSHLRSAALRAPTLFASILFAFFFLPAAAVAAAPKAPNDCAVAATILTSFNAWLDGELDLSDSDRADMLVQFRENWDGCYTDIEPQVRAFMANYESRRPPLFQSRSRIHPDNMAPESHILYLIQQWLFDNAFVDGSLDTVAGIAYEAAEVFPGPVAADAPRVDATVRIDASYHTHRGYFLNGQAAVRRMTGYYAAPGEVIEVQLGPEAAGMGLQVMIGAHQDNLDRAWDSFNRFPRVGNKFHLKRLVTQAANPFGGGIYIEVPDGTDLGEVDIELRGVVKTPYFSIRSGAETTADRWQQERDQAGVAWFDWEADYFMITLPVSMVRGIDDPSEILDIWSRAMVVYARLGGRPTQRIRAEYFSIDRQIAHAGTAMPAQYPIMTGDDSVPNVTGHRWWSPLNVFNGNLPDDVIFHELGHLHNYPTMQFEIESNVNLPAVFVYNEIFGLDIDEALVHSRHQLFTRDEAAVDWVISSNFRDGKRIGFNEIDYARRWNELAYQQRGHAKWVDLAALFDWDALGAVFEVFYRENETNGGNPIIGDDKMIRTASQVLNANVAPLFAFWGIPPSDALFDELAALPRPQKILDRLRHYRAIVPTSQAEFLVYHERMKNNYLDPNGRARFDRYQTTFTDAEGAKVAARIDGIIERYYGETSALPAAVTRDGLQLYLAADRVRAKDKRRLARWPDASGRGHDATVVRDLSQLSPYFLLNGTDNKAVVRFNSADFAGMIIDDRLELNRPYTIFVVDAYPKGAAQRGRSLHSRDENWLLGRWSGRTTHYADGWMTEEEGESANGVWAVHVAVGDEKMSRYILNGIDQTVYSYVLGRPGRLGLGKHGGLFSEQGGDVDVAEVIVYDRVLSKAEVDEVNAYLMRKYVQPTALPEAGLQMLLAADSAGVGAGQAVALWPDQSGRGNHASEVLREGGFRPTYQQPALDGVGVIRFNGTRGDGLDLNRDWFVRRPYSFFLVDAYSSAGSVRGRSLSNFAGDWFLGRWDGSATHYANGWVGPYRNIRPDDVLDVHTALGDDDGSAYFLNGRNLTEWYLPFGEPGYLGLGRHSSPGGFEIASDLDVASVIVYDRVLTKVEQALVERFLMKKYRAP